MRSPASYRLISGAALVLLTVFLLPLLSGVAAGSDEPGWPEPKIVNAQSPDTKDVKATPETVATPKTTTPVAIPIFPDDIDADKFEIKKGHRTWSDKEDANNDSSRNPSSRGRGLSRPPGAVTTRDNITFIDLKREAYALAIGPEGRVFSLDTAGNIYQWSNTRREFLAFNGQLARLVVGPNGTLWGVNSLGRIFTFNGKRWDQVLGEIASDIAVNYNGDVVEAREDGLIKRFNAALDHFVVEEGLRGVQIALFSDGSLVAIRDGNLLCHCADGNCVGLGRKATSLSVGPDDSLFIVDANGRLYRSTDRGASFAFVPTLGRKIRRVAVGPYGFPWVVTTDNDVLYSHFFERNEEADNIIRLAATGDTIGTGRTGAVVSTEQSSQITFNKTMRFDIYRSEGDRFSSMIDLVVGNDNNVYISGSKLLGFTIAIDKFDERRRRFINIPYPFPADVLRFEVEADGKTFWGIKTSAPAKIYRANSNGLSVTTYTVGSGSGSDIALDHDGNVYAVVGERAYVKKRGASSFRLLSSQPIRTIAFGTDKNIWITDDNNIVLKFDGKRFVNPARRPTKVGGVAVSPTGAVYVIAGNDLGNPQIFKYNATNRSFDPVRNTTPELIDITDDGRLWYTQGLDIKRAR